MCLFSFGFWQPLSLHIVDHGHVGTFIYVANFSFQHCSLLIFQHILQIKSKLHVSKIELFNQQAVQEHTYNNKNDGKTVSDETIVETLGNNSHSQNSAKLDENYFLLSLNKIGQAIIVLEYLNQIFGYFLFRTRYHLSIFAKNQIKFTKKTC